MEGLENELWRRWSGGKVGEWAELILQTFRHFTYITTHSSTLPSLYLRHSSFSNPTIALPTSQLILQPYRHFTYVTTHSPTLPSVYLRHNSFSNPTVALTTSQLILQPYRRFTYVTAHSPTLPLLHLRHSSFYNPSFASPKSQALHLIHLASRPWLRRSTENEIGLCTFCIRDTIRTGEPGSRLLPIEFLTTLFFIILLQCFIYLKVLTFSPRAYEFNSYVLTSFHEYLDIYCEINCLWELEK